MTDFGLTRPSKNIAKSRSLNLHGRPAWEGQQRDAAAKHDSNFLLAEKFESRLYVCRQHGSSLLLTGRHRFKCMVVFLQGSWSQHNGSG